MSDRPRDDGMPSDEWSRLQRLDEFLGEARDVPVPDGIPEEVMRRVREISSRPNFSTGSVYLGSTPNGMKPNKEIHMGTTDRGKSSWKPILAAAAVVAAIGIVAFVKGYGPTSEEAAGTVGAAKKFEGGQIKPGDVKVEGIGAQEFLQSETFDRLVKDPAAREILASDAFRDALLSDAFRDALRDDSFRNALLSDAFRDALRNDAFRDALRNDAFRNAFASDAFRDAFTSDAFRDALAGSGDALDAQSARVPALKPVLADASFRDALRSEAFRDALRNDAFRDALRSEAFRDALRNDAFRDALRSEAFRDALRSDAFRDALRSEAFRDALRLQ